MFCPNCGSPIPDGYPMCVRCANHPPQIPYTMPPQPPMPQYPAAPQYPPVQQYPAAPQAPDYPGYYNPYMPLQQPCTAVPHENWKPETVAGKRGSIWTPVAIMGVLVSIGFVLFFL